MSNIHRLRLSDRIFFVTTNLRRDVNPFRTSEYPLIIDALEASRSKLRFALCGYVLMPDHLHALFAMSSPMTVSRVLRDIKTSATCKLHKARGIKGPLWQHQFWDRFVRNQREFHERLDYMHMNPVRKGLVTQPEAWQWSSCGNFSPDKAKAQQCPIQIDFVQLPEDYCA